MSQSLGDTQRDSSKSGYCRRCGTKLLPESLFCDKCGTKVSVYPEESAYPHQLKETLILDEAVQKRIATATATEKKKKLFKILGVFAVVIILIAFTVDSVIESSHNAEVRNFAAETMSDAYTNVYADIVSMEPEYFVYTTSGSTNHDITEVICKCKTVEGITIWATIDIWEYPGGSANNEASNKNYYYSKSNPMRLVGRVTTAEKVIEELAHSIGHVFVLDVTALQDK